MVNSPLSLASLAMLNSPLSLPHFGDDEFNNVFQTCTCMHVHAYKRASKLHAHMLLLTAFSIILTRTCHGVSLAKSRVPTQDASGKLRQAKHPRDLLDQAVASATNTAPVAMYATTAIASVHGVGSHGPPPIAPTCNPG